MEPLTVCPAPARLDLDNCIAVSSVYPAKPSADTIEYLKAEGFRWNPKRKVWQHAGGVFSRQSPDDPRLRYGAIALTEEDARQ